MTIGFIGLGLMGGAMAANLVRDGTDLIVWNRTAAKSQALRALGAEAASSPKQVFDCSTHVIIMLADQAVTDLVLRNESGAVHSFVAGRTIINMGTYCPDYVTRLADATSAAGGSYAEVTVSGSRKPAESGTLLGMLAALPHQEQQIEHIVRPMCEKIIRCGVPPQATCMKLAVNHYLISSVAALAEAASCARSAGVNLSQFASAINDGPLGSVVTRTKLDILSREDFSPQASISDVRKNAGLSIAQAHKAGVASPILAAATNLFVVADQSGLSGEDMMAVTKMFERC